jgi:hypothetical protein
VPQALDPDDTWPRATRKRIREDDETVASNSDERRIPSGPVFGSTHNSGFDEILPTNTQRFLQRIAQPGQPAHVGGDSKELGGTHGAISKARARQLLSSCEGMRVDTAASLLAMRGGDVAFHTHAGGPTTGQAEGHDLRRRAFARGLSQTLSPAGDAVLGAAIMLASRPPARTARSRVNTKLLRDKVALAGWERDRHSMKRMTNAAFHSLPAAERAAIRSVLRSTYDETNENQVSGLRRLAAGVPTSPRRQLTGGAPGEAIGGDYVLPEAAVPGLAPPTAAETASAFSRRVSGPGRRVKTY